MQSDRVLFGVFQRCVLSRALALTFLFLRQLDYSLSLSSPHLPRLRTALTFVFSFVARFADYTHSNCCTLTRLLLSLFLPLRSDPPSLSGWSVCLSIVALHPPAYPQHLTRRFRLLSRPSTAWTRLLLGFVPRTTTFQSGDHSPPAYFCVLGLPEYGVLVCPNPPSAPPFLHCAPFSSHFFKQPRTRCSR